MIQLIKITNRTYDMFVNFVFKTEQLFRAWRVCNEALWSESFDVLQRYFV